MAYRITVNLRIQVRSQTQNPRLEYTPRAQSNCAIRDAGASSRGCTVNKSFCFGRFPLIRFLLRMMKVTMLVKRQCRAVVQKLQTAMELTAAIRTH